MAKPGACIIATIPDEDDLGISLMYRVWEVPAGLRSAAKRLPPARRKTYRRAREDRDVRENHRHVKSSEFSPKMSIDELVEVLFPAH